MLQQTLMIIAQTTAPAADPQNQPSPGGGGMMIGLILMIVVFYFVLFRGNRKQQQEKKNLLNNLAKNDKIMTIGGIIGTIVSVKDNEVVVRVDESNNTKMTFLKSSIQQVMNKADGSSTDTK